MIVVIDNDYLWYSLINGFEFDCDPQNSLKMGEFETPSKAETNESLYVTKASQFKYTPSTLVFCGGRNFKPLGVKFLPCSSLS